MFCSSCGKENDDDAKFCIHCGIDFSKKLRIAENKHDIAIVKPELDKKEASNQVDNFVNNDSNFSVIVGPIIDDFKSGNSKRALKIINEYINNESTDSELRHILKKIKEIYIESESEKLAKNLLYGPKTFTINGVGTRVYGDTLYFVFLFIPIFPIARYKLDNLGGPYTLNGKLSLHKWQNVWRIIDIILIIVLVITVINNG